MPITTAQIQLNTTTAVRICGPDQQPLKVTLHNLDSGTGKMIYIGNAGVTQTNSLEMSPQVFFQFILDPGDDLWAVANDNNAKIGVFVQRQD